MIFLRSLIFNIILILSIVLIGLLSLPMLLGPRAGVAFIRDVWIKLIIGVLRVVVGLRHEVNGLENLPKQNIIIAAKHQSAWETVLCTSIFDMPSIVLKKELIYIKIVLSF